MIHHVVGLIFKDGVTDEAIQQMISELNFGDIPAVRKFYFRPNLTHEKNQHINHNVRYVLSVFIENLDDLKEYLEHPIHVAGKAKMLQLVEKTLPLDFVVDAW
eukprot:m.122675 g.122675  ORF g.122675 m.122675 type:complete len:103 (-) comp16228_c0_seq1:2464-2772(-)